MTDIDDPLSRRFTRPESVNQSDDGLGQPNPSPIDEIVRRGQEALDRKRRDFDDWMLITEALQVGRAEIMAVLCTNRPTGKRFEHAMGKWLHAHAFHIIDKCTRNHLLECLKHRAEIEKWRASIKDDGERFRLNHPTTVLRKWKAATVVPDPNAPEKKPSLVAKYKEVIARLEEENHRMRKEIERGGGDLWAPKDTAENIARVMVANLTTDKAKKVAEAIIRKVKEKNAAQSKTAAQNATDTFRQNVEKAITGMRAKPAPQDPAASAEEGKAQYAAEDAEVRA
jgi:hypothetical protein